MMFEKLAGKGALMRLVTVLLIASVAILALNILTENRAKLDELAKYLYERETITGEEFMEILDR